LETTHLADENRVSTVGGGHRSGQMYHPETNQTERGLTVKVKVNPRHANGESDGQGIH
jgi:hypothetical protein